MLLHCKSLIYKLIFILEQLETRRDFVDKFFINNNKIISYLRLQAYCLKKSIKIKRQLKQLKKKYTI